MAIVRDEGVLGGEPRIEGTRIGVHHVAGSVIDARQTPASVADQLDISLGAVYEALAYYYANPEEMRAVEARHERAVEEARRRSTLVPPDDA
jgi:uncharacterized protein (DUF433 family)